MPIFRVRFNFDTVVKADNEAQALKLAFSQREEIIREDVNDPHFGDISVLSGITKAKELPPAWNRDCIPWGQKVRSTYCMEEDLNDFV